MGNPEEERWVWVAFAKEHRLILCIVTGPKVQDSANKLIEGIDACLDKTTDLPLFVSDGNDQYRIALLTFYNETVTPPKTGKRGRPKKPYKVPRTDLKYGQVVKERKRGKLVNVHKKIVFGDENKVPLKEITTSHIERQNLTFRQENERLARKTLGFSKKDFWLERHMTFYMTFFNFSRVHSGLKVENENYHFEGPKYIKRTPMMAIGKTDRVWGLEELLSFSCLKTSVG